MALPSERSHTVLSHTAFAPRLDPGARGRRSRRFSALCLATSLLTSPAAAQVAPGRDDAAASPAAARGRDAPERTRVSIAGELAQLIARERARFGISGIAVVLVARDSILLVEGFGWADSLAGVAARADMAVPLGSGRGDATGPAARGLLWTLDGRRLPVPPVLGGSRGSALAIAREIALAPARAAPPRDLTAPGYTATIRTSGEDAAVVLATLDQATAVTRRLAELGLQLVRARRSSQAVMLPDTSRPLPPGLALRLMGRYGMGDRAVLLEEFAGRLFLTRARGGIREEVRQRADGVLETDDVAGAGTPIRPLPDGRLVVGADALTRRPERSPPPPAPELARNIGEYGSADDPLYILEDDGRAVALIQRVQAYPLRRRSARSYLLTGPGPLSGRRLDLLPGQGEPRAGVLAGDTLLRRLPLAGAAGATFRIEPLRPIAVLRAEALAATPPAERGTFRTPELVELRSLDPTIHYDIRYATPNNFMGTPMYTSAHAFLQRPAAEALVRVSAALRRLGYGLLVHDAYRPWYVTRMFWDATPPADHEFVADPAHGSRHNRGCAVDITLYDLVTGRPLPMTGGYDEMTERSLARYPGGTSRQRWDRDLLRRAMRAEGFTVLDAEWWHFDYRDWPAYSILNLTFEDLARRQ